MKTEAVLLVQATHCPQAIARQSTERGKGDNGQQQAQLCRDLQSGVLKVQTAGFGIAETAFDGPPPPGGVQGVLLCQIACDDKKFASLDALGREDECQGRDLSLAREVGAEFTR